MSGLAAFLKLLPVASKEIPKLVKIGQKVIDQIERRKGRKLSKEELDTLEKLSTEGTDEDFNNYFNS